MAEGWGRYLKGGQYQFYSAGIKSCGLNPLAVRVMNESGVDISAHRSKTTEELSDIKMDYVVTVCSDTHETCPHFTSGKFVHHGFDDPPRLAETLRDEIQVLDIYRRVRDEIKEFVAHLDDHLE